MDPRSPASRTVCVVVPAYRNDLSPAEQVSLDRCIEVLGNHPVILAVPASLDLAPLLRRHPHLASESFPDTFFASVMDYNRLLLSDEFYARFAAYDYMLVHQLDAFVFSDRLLAWCERGYDYVGAPWIPDNRIPGMARLAGAAIRRQWFRLTRRQYRHGGGDHHGQQHYSAGNGGFSLRRIATMRAVLARLHDRAEPYRAGTRTPWAEDVFFSVEANRCRRHVRVPGFREALEFAWETQPSVAARLSAVTLPFGCHGWDRLHRDEWRPVFAAFGHSLDDLLGPAPAG